MAEAEAFRECFAYSAFTRGPHLQYHFGFYSFLGDGALTAETLPVDEDIIEDDGGTIRVTKCAFLLVERGSISRLYLGIASLRERLFNGGSPRMVQRRSVRLHYGVRRRAIDQYLTRVTWHILRSMSEEQNSHRQSMVFHATFGCHFSVADRDSLRLNGEEMMIRESIDSATYATHPATREAVEGLQKTKVNDGRHCAICIEELSPDTEQVQMPCEHVYHKDCIVAWLKRSHVCPLCRFSLPHD